MLLDIMVKFHLNKIFMFINKLFKLKYICFNNQLIQKENIYDNQNEYKVYLGDYYHIKLLYYNLMFYVQEL